MRANNSFKPNLLRSSKSVAEKACHAFASTTQVGLIQVLGAARMVRHIADAFLLLCLASCTFTPADSDTEKLRKVLVPGYQTPSQVVYSRVDSDDCRAITRRTLEVINSEHSAFRDGYSQVRVSTPDRRYRAFFRPERLARDPPQSAFILCINDSTPISFSCSVVGVTGDSCFYTGYGWYKLSEIDSFVTEIRKHAPTWGGT